MTSINAMKLALEALENASPAAWASRVDSDTMKSIWRKHAEALEGLQVLLAELDNASCKSAQKRLEVQQPATSDPAAWLDEMLADTREVFDAGGSETPQVVRDVIEYVKSWVTVYSEKNHQAPAAQPAPSEPATGERVQADSSEHLRVIASLGAALRRLSFAAQTTGGTAGPDAELQSAIGQAEQALSMGGIWQAMAATTEPVEDGVPDGVHWFTVTQDGMPDFGEEVIGGFWYTDPWLKPDCATRFMWGQCRVVKDDHRDFKDGKRWQTFGPSHNDITHWARLKSPAHHTANHESQNGE